KNVREHMDNSFQRAYAAGVRIVLGTDAGTPFNSHGDNARELALMVQLGMAPFDALRAGTRNAAELLQRINAIGTIEPEKVADLVLCRGDVIADVGRLCAPETIQAVIQGGRIVHRTA